MSNDLSNLKQNLDKALSKYGTQYQQYTNTLLKGINSAESNKYIGKIISIRKNVNSFKGVKGNCTTSSGTYPRWSQYDNIDTCQTICEKDSNCVGYSYQSGNRNICEAYGKDGANPASKNYIKDEPLSTNPVTDKFSINWNCFIKQKEDLTPTLYFVTSNGELKEITHSIINVTPSCKNVEIINVDMPLKLFLNSNNFTLGKPMSASDTCQLNILDNPYHDDMMNSNNTLINLATEIYDKMNILKKRDVGQKKQKSQIVDKLHDDIKDYQSTYDKLISLEDRNETLDLMEDNLKLHALSEKYKYTTWGFLGIIIFLYTIYHINKK
uniref:Uncharacterized protein n=1 Tax=viral metagenome TaxID=1070528 RepID=A0A6C0KHL8_9ZZZZ